MAEAAPVVLSAAEYSGGLAAGQARMECLEITGSADRISGGKEYTTRYASVLGQFGKEGLWRQRQT